jgi:hypothetical protein
MPQIINCPDCERKLRVPDELLGKKVRCPTCSVMFRAVAVGGSTPVEDPIEEPDEEPAPRRTAAARDERYSPSPRAGRRRVEDEDDEGEDIRLRRRREDDEDDDDYYSERRSSGRDKQAGWGKVRIGINLVMIGIWAWIAGVVLGGLGVLLGVVLVGGALLSGSAQSGLASLGAGGILLLVSVGIYYLGAFAELVVRLIGYGLCMAAPAQRNTGLRPLAITAFSLAIAYAVFSVLTIVVNGFTGFTSSLTGRASGNAAGTGLNILSVLCAIASFVVFMFFLRSVCNNARARHLAGSPIGVLIAFVLYWVLTIFIVIIVACAGGVGAGLAAQSQSAGGALKTMGTWLMVLLAVVFLLGLVYLGLQVWYIMVLQKIRDAVASYRRRL